MPASPNSDLKSNGTECMFLQNETKYCSLSRFHILFSRLFFVIGKNVATRKTLFILVPLLLTLLGATGFQQVRFENDPETLFSSTAGGALAERALIEDYFTINYTHTFHPTRNTRRGRAAVFIVTAKDGGSILRKIIYDDLLMLDESVKNVSVRSEGKVTTYADICAMTAGQCHDNQVLKVAAVIEGVENKSIELLYPLNIEPFLVPHFYGGIKTRANGQVLDEAKAVQLAYYVRAGSKKDDLSGLLWEQEILRFMQNKTFATIDVVRFTSRTIEDELEKNTLSVVSLIGPTLAIATVFIFISGLMTDWVRSKPLLGLVGVLIAVFSTVTAFGLLMYCGAPFIGINMAAPFLMLGIGLDDTFVMLAAWRRTNIQDAVPQRLAQAYSEAAVSITVTSLTDMLSFYTGLMVPFPSIQIFCLYAGTAVLFTYIWHITLFGGCLAVAGYAEEQQRHSLSCIKIRPKSQSDARPFLFRIFCTGGINKLDPWNERDNRPHMIMKFFRDYVARFINNSVMKSAIIIAFIVYLCGALYGCVNLKEGLEMKSLSRDDSYSVDFYDAQFQYFRVFPYAVQVVITGNVTYSDPKTKNALLDLIDVFESQTYVNKTFTQSVMKSWYKFLNRTDDVIGFNITDEKSFIYYLQEVYLKDPYEVFNQDLVFSDDNTRIIALRMLFQTYGLWEPNDDKVAMEGFREIAKNSIFNVTVFNPLYIFFDQFMIVRPVTIQAVSVAAIAMVIISLIFIPNPWCSLCIGFSIISIEIGVIGYMALWDVNLDSISMLVLIMSIGFSVDFSAHISHAYLTAEVDSSDERVRTSLFNVGFPILQGGTSTVLSIVTFALAPSYIFKTFLKIVFLVILFGILHGIFLLPVLLSILGSGSRKRRYHGNQTALTTIELPRPVLSGYPIDETEKRKVSQCCVHCENNSAKKPFQSPDKDMGLGTSGEDSSENSSIELPRICYLNQQLKNTVIATDISPMAAQFFSTSYYNRGYTSDTDIEENLNSLQMSSDDTCGKEGTTNHHRRHSHRDWAHHKYREARRKRFRKSYSVSQVSSNNPYV